MATKGSKRTAGKAVVTKGKPIQSKPAAKVAARPSKVASSATAGAAPKVRAATPSRAPSRGPMTSPPVTPRASAAPSLIERAERLRDAIHESKLSAVDPWTYNAKARGWVQRAQGIVDEIARSGESGTLRQKLDALGAEVGADRDYQEAHRRT